MILDDRLEFADAVALNTGAPGTFNLGDTIDLKPATTSPGLTVDLEGSELYLMIQVDTTATGGATTGQFALVSDDQTPPLTNGTQTTHFLTAAIPVATLVAGYRVCCVALPSGAYERYLGVQQITGGAAFATGKINAFLTNDPALWRPYADNVA